MNEKTTMIGHEKEINYINNAIVNNKLSNSLLLRGSYGIGKSLFANIISEKIITFNNNFRGNFTNNIINIRANEDNKSGAITIDQIRNINREFHHTSANSAYRVVIIDAIDDLNINATNALLKMLEEPPEKVIFILINHSSFKTINTIESRCLKINLYDLTKQQSLQILQQQNINLNEHELENLNYIAENSPGRALDLHNNQGLEIYGLICQLLAHQDSNHLSKLTPMITGATQKDLWNIFEFIVITLLTRIHKSTVSINKAKLSDLERKLFDIFCNKYNANNLYQNIQEINKDIKLTSSLNLDKKSCLIKVFKTLS